MFFESFNMSSVKCSMSVLGVLMIFCEFTVSANDCAVDYCGKPFFIFLVGPINVSSVSLMVLQNLYFPIRIGVEGGKLGGRDPFH